MTGHHPEHEPHYEVAWRSVIKQDMKYDRSPPRT